MIKLGYKYIKILISLLQAFELALIKIFFIYYPVNHFQRVKYLSIYNESFFSVIFKMRF